MIPHLRGEPPLHIFLSNAWSVHRCAEDAYGKVSVGVVLAAVTRKLARAAVPWLPLAVTW